MVRFNDVVRKFMLNKKSNLNLATIFFGLSGLLVLGYVCLYFVPITNDAVIIQNSTVVTSPVTGMVIQISANQNQGFLFGESIMTVQPTQANNKYITAFSQHEQAKIDISITEQQIKVLELDLTMASDELIRLQDELVINKAESNLNSKLINQLSFAKKTQQHQINKIKQQIETAQTQLSKATLIASDVSSAQQQALLNSYDVSIRAKTAGYTTNVMVSHGDNVVVGQKLFEFIDTSQTLIQANFLETDLDKLKIGATVVILPRAYLGRKVFHGVVIGEGVSASLDSKVQTTSGMSTWFRQPDRIPVTIKIIDNNDINYRLLAGMTAYVYVQAQ